MRILGTLLLALGIGAVPAHGAGAAASRRQPATPSESEALIQRARALSAAGNAPRERCGVADCRHARAGHRQSCDT